MTDFLAHFPYEKARDIQARVLDVLSREWEHYDVFVVSAPTAFGKTALSRTIMEALGSVSVVTPTNQLVTQFQAEFPDTATLARLDSYRCEEWQRPCSMTRAKLQTFCKGCACGKAMAVAKYRGGPGIYNYHIYLAQKLYRDTLVVDEAHNLLPFIRERMAARIWQHDYHYPDNMYSADQIRGWIETLSPTRRRHKKIQMLWQAVAHPQPEYIPQRGTESFNGKGTLRGHPEDRDCLKILPVDISGAPAFFWPGLGRRVPGAGVVRKVVLMSATIGRKDIEALGLGGAGRARVLYVSAESPIAASRRPIISVGLVGVNRYNIDSAAQTIARYIEDVVLPQHTGQKGVIHASYQLAGLLRSHLLGDRYLFHSRENKSRIYEEFRSTDATSGKILIASGMYEGVDLPGDLGRWQVIAKVPWESLGSPAIRYQADKDPEWYAWNTLRTLIQACGRICRTEEDYGVTLILDASVDKLLTEYQHLLPPWYQDALLEGRKLL